MLSEAFGGDGVMDFDKVLCELGEEKGAGLFGHESDKRLRDACGNVVRPSDDLRAAKGVYPDHLRVPLRRRECNPSVLKALEVGGPLLLHLVMDNIVSGLHEE